MNPKIKDLTDEREKTHGSFRDNCESFDRLLEAVPLERYHPLARYSISNIYTKLARMSGGMSMQRQHIEDIAGYAEKLLELIDSGGYA